ncbi:MAG: N-succinylarginine dihydrolase [Polyangiaceae bacterium]
MIEVSFDGIVGPSHNFAGLSVGNVASTENDGSVSNPRGAALQGLRKMRAVRDLGVTVAVLPPQLRPHVPTLRTLGFTGSDEVILKRVAEKHPHLLRLVSSASAMWSANAATVSPGSDTLDGRVHIVPANLRTMFHRAIEAETTRDVLRAIFGDPSRFVVHEPLPGGAHYSDEGAANHTRLYASDGNGNQDRATHLFAWGRSTWGSSELQPKHFPARQTREASEALARLLSLDSDRAVFPQQHPDGIDRGAFHTDVLAVGTGSFFMLHELAFLDHEALLERLKRSIGDSFRAIVATEADLPVADAVAAYPFNSQVLVLPGGDMAIVAPTESEENPRARAFLERVVESDNPVKRIIYLDVRQSMKNGGGPACLRQRIPLRPSEIALMSARVIFDVSLEAQLTAWVEKHYRDKLEPKDLSDPSLYQESLTALDELSRILVLGSVYEFQR